MRWPWSKGQEEAFDIIGGQLSEKEPEVIYPEVLAEKQREMAQFIPRIKKDPIKEITEQQNDD